MESQFSNMFNRLLASEEPSVRLNTYIRVVAGSDRQEIERLQTKVKHSKRVTQLLQARTANGEMPSHPYAKWYGQHWVLASLAELGYPMRDDSLIPMREQVYRWLFSLRINSVNGLPRAHASMEANALHYLLRLGLNDDRTDELAERLIEWQWPDGGWNCDRHPEAKTSSFNESLIPLRGLALHAEVRKKRRSREGAERAAEYFLKRRLFRRVHDGRLVASRFMKLHYPPYWHYDFLFGLKVMAEAHFLQDERCLEALRLLEARRLPDGGFPVDEKYYRLGKNQQIGRSPVDWGGSSASHMNEFLTVDALYVLRESGRIRIPRDLDVALES